jgi:hypothetical protein
MIIGKFENMVRNHMLLIIDVKAAIVCKTRNFTGGYKLSAIAKNLQGQAPISL